jgi:hypothetical protein
MQLLSKLLMMPLATLEVLDPTFTCAGAITPVYLLRMQPENLLLPIANEYWI